MKRPLSNNQKGFSLAFIAIVAIIIFGLGLAGWRVYAELTTKNATTTNTSTGSEQLSTDQDGTRNKPTIDEGSYLDIKEAGVKVKLNNGIKDAVYAPYYNPSNDGSAVYGISAQSLIDSAASDKLVDCRASRGALGLIIVTSAAPTYTGQSTPLPVDNKYVFKIDTKYYHFVSAQQLCGISGPEHETLLQQATAKLNAFIQSFATLQAD